ncbi:T9SS type A sorting domain-containing protein, partial [candidate division KSB1 bacterium]|nr:T9SS type A sorting domain-containing protein [candidate division KSB1 bacterium]
SRTNSLSFFTICFFVFLLIHITGFCVFGNSDATPDSGRKEVTVNITESSAGRLLVEFSFPKPIDGAIRGCQQNPQPGHPALPFKSVLIASPPNSEITCSIIDAEKSELDKIKIQPVPTPVFYSNQPGDITRQLKSFEAITDEEIYKKNEFYPADICRVEKGGFFRNVYVNSLAVYPIRFNPVSGKIIFHHRVVVEITFHNRNALGKSAGSQDHEVFRELLQKNVINYSQAGMWNAPRLEKQIPQGGTFFTGDRFKIEIDREGLYYLSKSDLENAGLNLTGVDPRYIKIFHRSNELPIYVHGETDGFFHDTDYIEFYATGIKSRYTLLNVYWLLVDNSPGKRVSTRNGYPAGTTVIVTSTKEKYHFERDKHYETSIPGGPEQDHFFWDYIIAPKTLNFTLPLDFVSPTASSAPLVRYAYQGFSSTAVEPDHRTVVILNGETLADNKWDGQISYVNQATCAQNLLKTGDNTLAIRMPGDTGSNVDIIWINWFEIEYWRDLVAKNNFITFSPYGAGSRQFSIRGFTSSDIIVYDVTDTLNPNRIENIKTDNDGAGYKTVFQDNLSGSRKYLAVAASGQQKPVTFSKVAGDNLNSPSNQADYIIITPENFISYLEPLVQYRQKQGLTVKIVTIDKIFNEFNHGIKEPEAIRQFLHYVYHYWYQPAPPAFVLLVGDASYDSRGVLGFGNYDYVPTHLFETGTYHTETSSDNWFACVNGDDDIPDMMVGRIPARNGNQVDQFVQKITNYEKTTLGDGWVKNVLFIADNADEGGNFESTSDLISENVVAPFNVQKVYLRDAGSANAARSAIINQFNNGCLIANYLGHGSLDNWASETMFGKSDIKSLNNNLRYPIVVTLSCLNGFFHHAENAYCLAEEFVLNSQRGSIASYSPSGFGYASADKILADGLYTSIFKHQNSNLGSVILESKLTLIAAGQVFKDHVKFFNLFGDPATQLPIQNVSIPQSAYFFGKLLLHGEKAPAGTKMSAWINNIKCSKDYLIKNPGEFGLLQVWADNPATGIKEGGVNNDKVGFQVIYGENDTSFAVPSVIWKTATTRHIDLNVIHEPDTPVRVESLVLDIWINDKKIDDELLDGDTIAGNPVIRVKIKSDRTSNILPEHITVRMDNIQVSRDNLLFLQETDNQFSSATVVYESRQLCDGHHQLYAEIQMDGTQYHKTFNFNSSSRLCLDKVFNYPNPMQEATKFTYYLKNDKSALVSIKIFSLAGRLLRVIEYAPGEVGFNTVFWDGTDADGDRMANGVYFYKIIAKDDQEQTEYLEKLVIAQ